MPLSLIPEHIFVYWSPFAYNPSKASMIKCSLCWTWLFLRNFKVASSLTVSQAPGIHLDLLAFERPPIQNGRIGLGDYADAIYNVQIQVGGNRFPVVLGVLTNYQTLALLTSGLSHPIAIILTFSPQNSPPFQPSNVDATLLYGDSYAGTHAFGRIGQDSINLAGLHVDGQYIAAINNTNTSGVETGSVGILGLGFPRNRAIWSKVFLASRHALTTRTHRQQHAVPQISRDYSTAFSPHIEWLTPISRASNIDDASSMTSCALASYSSQGPLLVRLIELNCLFVPGFTVPLRRYLPSHGGLHSPNETPNETYPITWETYLHDVYLDGHKLPRSNLSSPAIPLSALVDTGNSLIRGPPNIVSHIYHILNRGPAETFPCDTPHMLAFEIGGRMFPVDPRDFISQAFENQVELCTANLVDTDVPVLSEEGGCSIHEKRYNILLLWKHYTPFNGSPRMGFKSTVPLDAGERLKAAIEQTKGKRKINSECEDCLSFS
ncbi:aspartic peptidase domain-containing protein [Flagelloscypha sp. PMI_526]|nr:aspartic peptidase domain-containing protein [Flagelloscypha sp. PMI_526]